MSRILDYLFYHLVAFGGFWGLVAILVFLVGYYFLFRRRDYQTAIEITCVAWLMSLCSIALAIVGSFRTIDGNPQWWEMELYQYKPFVSILFIPTLLTHVWVFSKFFRGGSGKKALFLQVFCFAGGKT